MNVNTFQASVKIMLHVVTCSETTSVHVRLDSLERTVHRVNILTQKLLCSVYHLSSLLGPCDYDNGGCQNGGSCQWSNSEIFCSCPNEFDGDYCEIGMLR